MDKKCLLCNLPIEGRKNKKFCNQTCKTRYNARVYHNMHKNDLEYKLKAKIRLKEWVKNNRERFNETMRKYNKVYMKKQYHIRLKNDKCPACGKDRDSKYKNCENCRKKWRKSINSEKCPSCGLKKAGRDCLRCGFVR